MKVIAAIVIALGCLGFCQSLAHAQSYPSKPITIVVAYPPGGATDVLARAVAQHLTTALGQPVVIENKGGAATQIGAEFVSRATPDGYTLLATDGATFTNPYLYSKLSYDPVKDFVPVAGLGRINQALAVHPSFPARTVTDLIALAKAKPGALDYATLGIGSSSHLAMEMLERLTGAELTAVHYKGGAPALTDVLAGHVPMVFLSMTLTAQPWQAGRLRLLGVGSSERPAGFPELPTIAETVPGFEAAVWFGLFAPGATPQPAVTRLNAEVQRVLSDVKFNKDFLTPSFYEPILGSPEQFAQFVRSDARRWGKVIQEAKLSLD